MFFITNSTAPGNSHSARLSLPIVILLLSIVLSNPLHAFTPMTSGQLSLLCSNIKTQPESSNSQQCARYIKGFIDGAIALDSSITKHKNAQPAELSKSERVIRGYLNNRIARFAKPENNEFCLGKPVPLQEIVMKVAEQLALEQNTEELALYSVYATLRAEYPCSDDEH